MALNMHNGLLPVDQCYGQGTPLLTGQLFHFPQCHNGLVSSRNEHVCLYHSIATGGYAMADERVLSIFPSFTDIASRNQRTGAD